MITIYSRGQLGNQLFQYAFGYSKAKEMNTFFAIDKLDTKDSLGYFMLKTSKMTIKDSLSKFLYRLKLYSHPRLYKVSLSVLQLLNKKTNLQIEEECWANPTENLQSFEKNTIFKGYFQSFDYFQSFETEIRELFRISPKISNSFHEKFGNLFTEHKTIVLHIRRNDYLHLNDEKLGGKDLSLPYSYYENALNSIEAIETYKIIIVGDDMTFIKDNFKNLENSIFISESEIIDFQIIMNADIAVIANSTFAWWAAFLNSKKNKKIIAPKYWQGFKVNKEFPNGISSHLDWAFMGFLNNKI